MCGARAKVGTQILWHLIPLARFLLILFKAWTPRLWNLFRAINFVARAGSRWERRLGGSNYATAPCNELQPAMRFNNCILFRVIEDERICETGGETFLASFPPGHGLLLCFMASRHVIIQSNKAGRYIQSPENDLFGSRSDRREQLSRSGKIQFNDTRSSLLFIPIAPQ